ncbi:MAG TPA: DUF1456 family protein [Spirochaetia bacterium]|nr:DUF1456 family protein [Spirochaetia bacterium]
MTNNDVLRRLRYALNLPDGLTLKIFALGGKEVSESELERWLKKEEDPGYAACRDETLGAFLDGFITLRRGPRPGSSATEPPGNLASAPERLTNNLILKKLRIALAWQEEEVLGALASGGLSVSKNELSALFRKPGQKNYKPCGDQLLRAFLTGMTGKTKLTQEEP